MGARIHRFETSGEAYDASQTRDDIKDGDILSVPSERAVAVLIEAWPTAVSENSGEFEVPNDTLNWTAIPTTASGYEDTKDYSDSFELAVAELNWLSTEAAKKLWDEATYQVFKEGL